MRHPARIRLTHQQRLALLRCGDARSHFPAPPPLRLFQMLAQEGRDVELVVLFAEFVGLGPL
jgi:hypothetical protein